MNDAQKASREQSQYKGNYGTKLKAKRIRSVGLRQNYSLPQTELSIFF